MSEPKFFASAAKFRAWLARHGASETELLMGFYKIDSGRGGITYPQALDEALCHGWIDGVRRALDADSFTIRFSPRKPTSIWSNVNIAKVEALEQAGRMTEAGRAAFAKRRENRSGVYAFENRPQELPAAYAKVFKATPAAWTFFQAQPPGYRRTLVWWVISAKQEATQQKRLATLIAESAAGRRMR